MRNDSRILIPFPSPLHGLFLQAAADGAGLNWRVLHDSSPALVSQGLSLVNNDACGAAHLSVAQVWAGMAEVPCGESSSMHVCLPFFCSGCRAYDQPYLVQRMLRGEGFDNVEVEPFFQELEKIPSKSADIWRRLASALVMADIMIELRTATFSCLTSDAAASFDSLWEDWVARCIARLNAPELLNVVKEARELYDELSALPHEENLLKPFVGIAGTASAIFNPSLNGGLIDVLEGEGCRVVVPYLSSMVVHSLRAQGAGAPLALEIEQLLRETSELEFLTRVPTDDELRERGTKVVPAHMQRGQGWWFAGWITWLLEQGVSDIVYAGLFGCLSGHVNGVAVLTLLRRKYPSANFAAVEYDTGTSLMNQVNRLKLMASIAWTRLKRREI